jgi:hypothetical protein
MNDIWNDMYEWIKLDPRLSSKQAYNLGKEARKSPVKNPFDKDTENDLLTAWQKGYNTVDFPRR